MLHRKIDSLPRTSPAQRLRKHSDQRTVPDGLNVAVSPFAGCIDDCETAYETATRLADYLRYGGYNSAVIGAASAMQATPSLDVDNVEVMLRVFDREELALLPSVEFAAPLPQLELLRRGSDAKTSGLEWVGPDGAPG